MCVSKCLFESLSLENNLKQFWHTWSEFVFVDIEWMRMMMEVTHLVLANVSEHLDDSIVQTMQPSPPNPSPFQIYNNIL